MKRTDTPTKALSVSGTVLVSAPILAPLVFSALRLAQSGRFRFDWLMPAELFPVAIVGGILLLVAAFRARTRLSAVGLSLALAIGMLVTGQVLAVMTGLADGRTRTEGLPWILVIGSLAIYAAALVFLGITGVLLSRDLFRYHEPHPTP